MMHWKTFRSSHIIEPNLADVPGFREHLDHHVQLSEALHDKLWVQAKGCSNILAFPRKGSALSKDRGSICNGNRVDLLLLDFVDESGIIWVQIQVAVRVEEISHLSQTVR